MNEFIKLRNQIYEAGNLYTFPLMFFEDYLKVTGNLDEKYVKGVIRNIKKIELEHSLSKECVNVLLLSLGENPYLDRFIVDTILKFTDESSRDNVKNSIETIILEKAYNCQKLYHMVEICIEDKLDIIKENDLRYMLVNYKQDLDLVSLLVDYIHHFKRDGFKEYIYKFLEEDYPDHIKIQMLNVIVELYSDVKIDKKFLKSAIRHEENERFYDSYLSFLKSKIKFKDSGISMIQSMFYGDFEDSGKGNNGGLAILLKSLGDEIAKNHNISSVFTITIAERLNKPFMTCYEENHVFLRLPIYMDKSVSEPFLKRELFIKRSIRGYLEKAGVSPDIFHIRFLDNASKAMASLCKELNKKLVFTLTPDPHRNMFNETGGLREYSKFEMMGKLNKIKIGDELIYKSDGIIGIGNGQVREELEVYFPQFKEESIKKKLKMIGEGIQLHEELQTDTGPYIDLNEFSKLHGMDEDFFSKPIILNIGRLAILKGQIELLKAWTSSKLSDTHHLLIIGGDLVKPTNEEKQVIEFFEQHMRLNPQLKNKFFHKGAMTNTQVRLLEKSIMKNNLSLPHIYLCSSLKEEFGIAILEAMSHGFLALAPIKGGVKSYIKNGINGFLIETSSGENIAQHSERYIYDSKLSKADFKMIQDAGRKTVEERFSMKKIANDFLNFYLSLEGAEK